MNLNVEESGPVERRLRIEVPTADVDAAFDAVYRDIRKKAQLKGFRKGKAPRAVLEKYYGEHAQHEVMETLVRETLFKALEDSQLDVISEPSLDPGEHPQQGQAFAYQATVEIRPVIELKQVEGLEVTRKPLDEPEEDPVEAQLEHMRQGQAQVAPEDEGVAAAQGHICVLDFEGRIDGEVFEGGAGEGAEFEIGANRTIPGFEDALVGLRVGDEKDFDVTFPEDYGAEHLAGKQATFHVALKELRRKEVPELDDEFAKDVSEFETLEELRADIARRFEERREQQRKQLDREAVIEALIAANPFPVPNSIVERALNANLNRTLGPIAQQLPQERVAELAERWREEMRPQSERDAAFALLVPEIAKQQGFEVTDEEVDAKLDEIASEGGHEAEEVKRVYRQQGAVEQIRGGLLEDRVVEFLLSAATLTDS